MSSEYSDFLERFQQRFDSAQFPWESVGVLGVAVTLWAGLFAGWVPMPSPTDAPMSAPGAMEAAATNGGGGAILAYLAMWGMMMSAMMYPAMLPVARRYVRVVDGDSVEKTAGLTAFFVTYSLVWAAVGLVPLAVDVLVGVENLVETAPALVYGGTLLYAGGYQFTTVKHRALQRCCTALGVVDPDVPEAVRLGVRHGRSCVVATWPLFALLVLVGSMNTFWMAGLTAVVVAQRLPAWGDEIADAVGVLAAVAGTLLVLPVPFPFP